MIRSTTAALLFSCVAVASVVDAQILPQSVVFLEAQSPAPAAPAPTRRAPARSFFRAYAMLDGTEMAAADSFNAVIGKSRITMPGGGLEVLSLWKGLFIRGAFSSVKETGSRVVVFDDEVISLGIPVTIELQPLEVAAGWRFRPLFRRLTPYIGGGLLRMSYKETSDFAVEDENTNETFTGNVVFGGLELSLVSWVMAGAEVQYRSVPDALRGGGVSELFDETDLGGVTVRVLLGIRR